MIEGDKLVYREKAALGDNDKCWVWLRMCFIQSHHVNMSTNSTCKGEQARTGWAGKQII